MPASNDRFPLPPEDLPLLPRISDYPAWHASYAPDAPAASLGDELWTYAELTRRVDEIARALIASGVQGGDRVALLSPPNPLYLAHFLATASIGAIWVGLNPKYQLDELRYVVGDCRPRLIFGRRYVQGRDYLDDLTDLVATAGADELTLMEADAAGGTTFDQFCRRGVDISDGALEERRHAVQPRDPCLIVYTSGSTGRPKGAMLHHEGMVIPWHDEREHLREGRLRLLNYYPINHIACLGDVSAFALVLGGKLCFMEKFDVAGMLAAIGSERMQTWGGVPSIFELAMNHPAFETADFSSVTRIFWGGAAMPAPRAAALAKIATRFGTNYGLSESCGPITATGDMIVNGPKDIARAIASVGVPTPSYQVRLRAPDGSLVTSPGVDGEIEAVGRPLFLGYWNRPDANAQAFTEDGWFRTGDVGAWLADGRLSITGRIKEMYKSGGYNVYPREIEMLLETHPAVAEAAVVGIPDPMWSEVGAAFILPRASVTAEELAAFCRNALANYKVPKRIEVVDELPRLPVGKVDKVSLRRRFANTG